MCEKKYQSSQALKLSCLSVALVWCGLWCLTPLSKIFHLYRGGCRNCRKTSNPVSDKSFGIFTVYYYIYTTYEAVEFVF
jgi:hypothetical protein